MGVAEQTLSHPHGMSEHDYHLTKCAKSYLQVSRIMILGRRAWQMSGSGRRQPHILSNDDSLHLNIALYIALQIKTITIDWGRIM